MFKSTFRPNDFFKIYICCTELSNLRSIRLECLQLMLRCEKYLERNFFSFIFSYTMDTSSSPKPIMFFYIHIRALLRVFIYNNYSILKA